MRKPAFTMFLARLRHSRAGNASVDAALGLPVLLMFLFGITEVSRAMWIQNNIQQAVEDAARCAAVNSTTCGTETQIKAYAVGKTYQYSVAASNFVYSTPSCGKQVAATVPFNSVVANFVPFELNLTARSCYPT